MSSWDFQRLFKCKSNGGGWCGCGRVLLSAHSDVEDGDDVEGRGEDGAHAFDGRLVQAVVGRQHLPAREKQHNTTIRMLHDTRPQGCRRRCAFMC